MSTENNGRKRISVIDKLITTGVERPHSPQEIEAIQEELFGDDWKEHERLKAEGKLDEIHIEDEEEEAEPWDESMIQEDDPEVEELLDSMDELDEEEEDH